MTSQEKDRYICQQLGICWHESLGYSNCDKQGVPINYTCRCGGKTKYGCDMSNHLKENPDFTTPEGIIKLLGIMRKRENWIRFLWRIMPDVPSREESGTRMLDNYILDNTGKLRNAAIVFLEARKEAV